MGGTLGGVLSSLFRNEESFGDKGSVSNECMLAR